MAVSQQDQWADLPATQDGWVDLPAEAEWRDVPESIVVDQAERVGKNVVSGGARGLADALTGPSFRELLRSGAIGKALGLPDVPGLTSMPSTAPRPTGKADAVRAYAERMRVPARPEAGVIERFATETLPQGAGSLGVNLALALPARAVPGRGAATLSVLQTSSLMGSGNAWDEAKKAGATDEVAFQHALTGYGLGMTQVVPMAKWLARTGAGGALRRALREGTEEAIQEWVQTTGQNVSAQKLFDPERPWLQGAGEATAAGATLGTVASLLFSIGGRKGRFAEKPRKPPTPDQDLAFEDESKPITGVAEAVKAANEPTDVPAGTAATPPVPEGPTALAEQFRLAADPKSTRAAALVTPGAVAPAVPEGLVAMETPHGTVVYNPAKVRPEDVANAAAGQLFDTSILGMSGQPVAASATAVTTSTPAARNVAAELTTPEGVAAAVAAQQASVPGGLTEVKPAEAVVAERLRDSRKEQGDGNTYALAQSQIDAIETRLEANGVDITRLADPTTDSGKWLIKNAGWQPMPPELVQAYAARDAAGAQQLALNKKELTARLGNLGLDDGEAARVLDHFAIGNGTDVVDQYLATTYTLGIARQPATRNAEQVAYALAAERGETFDSLKDISPKTLKDAAKAVQAVQDYFGLARVEDAQKGGEPRGQEEVQGQAPGQGLTAQQPGLAPEDVVRLSSMLPVAPEDDARYMQAVNTGDMETAQRMVSDAATQSGFEREVFVHETTSQEPFSVFKLGGPKLAQGQRLSARDVWGSEKLSGHAIWFRPESGTPLSEHRIGKKREVRAWLKLLHPLMGDRSEIDAYGGFSKDFPHVVQPEDAARLQQLGRDSVVYVGENGKVAEVLVFDPSQIKSADPVTRDASGNVIPLSQRFNPESPDIRYSSFVPGVPGEEAAPVASGTPERIRGTMQKAATYGAGPSVPGGTLARSDISDAVRSQVRNTLYRVQPMAEAWEKAGAYLDRVGLEAAQNAVMDSRSELTPSERVALAVRIESAMQQQERAATAAGNETLAQKIAEDTAAFIDLHIDWTSTESGRALVYQKLRLPESPRTRVAQYRRALKGARAQDRTELDGHIKTTIAEAAKAPAEAVLDLADDRQVQAEVSKVVDAAIEATPEVQEAARTLGVRVRERIARVRSWLRKAYGRIFHASFFGPGGRPPGTPVPRAPRAPLTPTATDDVLDAAIKRRMAALRQGIARVLKMRLTDQATTRDQLADQLAQATGLPPAQVAALAARLKQRYDSLLADRRQRIVARAAALAPRRHQQRKEPWQVLVDKVNEGTLNEQAIWDAMAGKLKLPAYDPAVAGEIARMATAAQDARSALDRQRAVQKLNDYIAAQTGPTIGEYWTAIWYMRMLSNPLTHAVNTLSNAAQSAVAFAAAASRHPTNAAYLGGAYFRGVLEGVPAILEVLRTGRTTGPRLLKAGMSSPLELPSMRPPGPIRTVSEVLRQWRIVGRLLTSEDMLFFHGLREMRAAQLALEEARGLGLRGRALYAEADRILGADPARMAWARTVAANEGRTGVEAERRALELRDEYRGPEMQEDMLDYALRNTFNTPHPYGVLGAMTRGIETALGEYPVGRLQVPFTRILANVGNESLEWVGLWRTLGNMGQAAWHGGAGGVTVHGRPAKLNDMWERALKQTLAFAAVTGLIYAVRELLKVPSEDRPWDLYGPGPSSPGANRQWRQPYGAKPFSLRIGKRIYNLNEYPMGAILAVAATYTDAWRFGELENKGTFTRLAVLVRGLGAAIMERSALAQVRDFFATMGGHGRMPSEAQVAQFLFRPLGGIVSSRLASFLDRVGDPTRYDTATMEGALLSQVAFARRNGKPDLNLWGQPIRSYVSDRLSKTWEPTPLDKFLVDNRAWVADPSPAQLTVDEGPPLSADEHYRFVERAGPEKFARLNEALPSMRQMQPEVVREFVSRLSSGINRRVKAEILAERPR